MVLNSIFSPDTITNVKSKIRIMAKEKKPETRTCRSCGLVGHLQAVCPTNPKPAGIKKKTQRSGREQVLEAWVKLEENAAKHRAQFFARLLDGGRRGAKPQKGTKDLAVREEPKAEKEDVLSPMPSDKAEEDDEDGGVKLD